VLPATMHVHLNALYLHHCNHCNLVIFIMC